ncbi:MAG: aspartyl protease family protein [Deltaproteobacteria bacterium]|nr:aspartyl protease family protein [Deltaproteobacteria bacterium]
MAVIVGTFRVPVEIGDPEGRRWETVEAVVDTGASYTVIPRPVLERLGVQASFRWPFVLADGRQVEYEMAETRVRLDGNTHTTLIVFREESAVPLLGAYTLEGFRLAPDPVGRRLIPVPGLLTVVRRPDLV